MSAFKLNPRLNDVEYMQRCELQECGGACCLFGAWVDEGKAKDILSKADKIMPHMRAAHRKVDDWFDDRREEDAHVPSGVVVHTRVVEDKDHYGGTACIFLREDAKCALQVAGETMGGHAWELKPFYCILHPLDLDDDGRITLDRTEELLDEAASCLRPAREKVELKVIFEEELGYLGASQSNIEEK